MIAERTALVFLFITVCSLHSTVAPAIAGLPSSSIPASLGSPADPKAVANHTRESRCLKAGRWGGALAGGTFGLLHISWSAAGVSGIHGPLWKNILTGAPSSIIGGYVGMRTTEWATRQILKGRPEPGRAALKGMMYGAIDGAITLAASSAPLLIMGHYLETIHFNFSDDLIVLKLLGASALGGALYGGILGAAIGAISGPGISLYMEF